MEDFGFGLTEMTWNGGSQFWPDWNGLERRTSFLASLEWFGMEEVGFVRTGMEEVSFSLTKMVWNGRSQFWPD
jgi:hypothetical protein